MKAKNRTTVSAAAPAAPAAVAAAAAAAPVNIDTPKGEKGAKPFDNLSPKQVAAARASLVALREGFDGIVRSEHAVAALIGELRAKGYHTLAKYTDFNTWVEDATEKAIPRTKSSRYDQAAQTLAACAVNSSRAAEAQTLSIDTLAKIAGKAKKGSADTKGTEKRAEHRASIARQSVAAYAEARKSGTAKDAEVAAGIREAVATSPALDFDGQVMQVINRAYALADQNHADAIRILTSALDRAKRMETSAREAAAAQRSK
jgi:hypothetical protein